MKLKKIASLMLAGIMAVSMLAACGEGKDNGGNAGSSSSQPTTSGVVAGVEAGIKSWNKDLDITVTNSVNMDSGIDKLFEGVENKKVTESEIVAKLNAVFNVNFNTNSSNWDFMDTGLSNLMSNRDDGDEVYRYAIVPVTKAAGDVNVYAGNEIGKALQTLENNVGTTLDVDYTLYVTDEAATMADNSVGTYVIAVLVTEFSTHL